MGMIVQIMGKIGRFRPAYPEKRPSKAGLLSFFRACPQTIHTRDDERKLPLSDRNFQSMPGRKGYIWASLKLHLMYSLKKQKAMKKLMMTTAVLLFSLGLLWAQPRSEYRTGVNQRIPLIGSEAPAFKAQSTHGEINFPKDFGSTWKVLFAHPRDFTPVCSSEILELAHQKDAFDKLNASIIVISTDELQSHRDWKAALEEVDFKGRGATSIDFPMVADASYAVVNKYGMLDSQSEVGQSIRGVFYIDPENRVRAFTFYPNEIGRSIGEVKRTLQALQTQHANERLVIPANWQPGEDVMLPYLTDEDKRAMTGPNPRVRSLNWFMNYVSPE